jgi:carbon-monoxide dehydrogenase small subunit
VLSATTAGKAISTIEGLAAGGDLHPLQQTFVEMGGVQCGYCTPGLIMASVALLEENLDPTDEELRVGLSNNMCRCTGYGQVFEAVMAAAQMMKEGEL